MIPLLDTTIEEKNALFSDQTWLYLLTLKNTDESIVIRIVNNPDAITFQGEEFTPFPFMLEEVTESNKGELPSVNLVMSNVDRIVQGYIENDSPNYGTGWSAHIDISYKSAIDTDIAEISYDFTTMNVSATESKVTFMCGIRNPIREQFPRLRMLTNSCQNTFKRGGCIYSGNDETCTKTLNACRQKFPNATKIPFLGFIGTPTNAIYI